MQHIVAHQLLTDMLCCPVNAFCKACYRMHLWIYSFATTVAWMNDCPNQNAEVLELELKGITHLYKTRVPSCFHERCHQDWTAVTMCIIDAALTVLSHIALYTLFAAFRWEQPASTLLPTPWRTRMATPGCLSTHQSATGKPPLLLLPCLGHCGHVLPLLNHKLTHETASLYIVMDVYCSRARTLCMARQL